MADNSPEHKRRTIRSFVRRAGRMTSSQQKALDQLWPEFGIDYSDTLLDINAIFGGDAPVVLEIGFGNGDTLVQQAAQHPEWNFIGIEVHEPGVGHCLLQARDAEISNLRVIMRDAIEVLHKQIPTHCIRRVNLYFPDPWPKKRHHKRRIVNARFLDLVAERLEDGGMLHIATDWANYAEHIDKALEQSDRFTCIERREHDGDDPLDRARTKFETRGLGKGHRIVDWRFKKLS